MTWNPLLDGQKAQPYLDKLGEISEVLLENTGKLEKNLGVMGGKAGVALFFFYYAQLTMEEKYIDFAHSLLAEIFDEINNEFTLHTLAGGLAGVGWTMELLEQNDFIEADTNEMLESLDGYLHKAMIFDIQKGNYDFLHGAVGTGTYFLSRLKNAQSKNHLIQLVDHLDELSQEDTDGRLKWESTLDHEKDTKGFNLSLSHGMSSIVVFLGKLLEQGIYPEKVKPMLEGGMRYILSHQLDVEKFSSNFPSWVSDEYPMTGSRLAWCYGDLGMGAALWQAARSVGNEEWTAKMVDVLLHTAKRRDLKENSVIDSGLCHGAAGMAHIYNRMFNNTGNETFKETALYWAEQTLKMAHYDDGYAGFKAWHTEKYGGWQPEAGFLEGVAGIGLMFVSLVHAIEPNWDRCLFLS